MPWPNYLDSLIPVLLLLLFTLGNTHIKITQFINQKNLILWSTWTPPLTDADPSALTKFFQQTILNQD